MAASFQYLSTENSSIKTRSAQNIGTIHSTTKPEPRKSHWGTTSGDVSSLILPYAFSICVALTHFSLFKHLDQKRVGVDTTVPQSWVSSTSLVLVTMFRISICLSLGVAFTQHMWRIVRLNSIKVADLDKYFSMQRDALMLLHSSVLRKVPSLYAMALIGFTIGLAIVFPPGALTVEGRSYQNVRHQPVGVFNASFMGNGSINNALDLSLVRRESGLMAQSLEPKPITISTAKMTLIAGELPVLKSPCGPNCTYVITYEGPQVKCHSYMYNETTEIDTTVTAGDITESGFLEIATGNLPAWQMGWKTNRSFALGPIVGNPYPIGLLFDWYSFDDSNINVTYSNDMYAQTTIAYYSRSVQCLECIPGYGTYIANFSFSNGVPTVQVNSTYSGSLNDLWSTVSKEYEWTDIRDESLKGPQHLIKIVNFQTAISSFFDPLVGQVFGYQRFKGSANGTIQLSENKYSEIFYQSRITDTIIMDTAFNTNRFKIHNDSVWTVEMLDITEQKINQALQNFTIALMQSNTQWNTTTNITESTYENTFVFSPTKLIVPYACCLLVVLPFLVLGYRALHLNGVPALSGGFVQTLMTTTGSEALHQAAAVGCLGGQRNVPKELKELEIIYGELRDDGNSGVKRATFGTREEIVKLEKGAVYGR